MELLMYLTAMISVCHHVGANPFRANKGTFDHMHENLYLEKIPDGQGYDMRYVPRVDGKPIFIPFDETFPPPSMLKVRPHSPPKFFHSTPKNGLKYQNKVTLEPYVKPLNKVNEIPKHQTPILIIPENLKTKESEKRQLQEEPDHPHVLDVVTRTVLDPNFVKEEHKTVSTHIKKKPEIKKPIKLKPTEKSKINFNELTSKAEDHSKKENPTEGSTKLHPDEVSKNKVKFPYEKKNGISKPLLDMKDYDSPLVIESLGKYDAEKPTVNAIKEAHKTDVKLTEKKAGKPIHFYPDKDSMEKLEYGIESQGLSFHSEKKSPVSVEQNFNHQDYDRPVIVEALVKKSERNLVRKPGMTYDSPIVVEALVRKTHQIEDQKNEHTMKHGVKHQYVQPVKPSVVSNAEIMPDDGYESPVVIRVQENKKHSKYHTQIKHSKSSLQNGLNQAEHGNLMDDAENIPAKQGIDDFIAVSVKQNFDQQDYDSPVIVRSLVKHNEENILKETGMTHNSPQVLVKKTGQLKDQANKHTMASDVHQIVHSANYNEASNKDMMPDDGYDSPVVIRVNTNNKHSKYQTEMAHSKSSSQNDQTQTVKHGEASNKEIMLDDGYDSPVVIRVENNKEPTKYQNQMAHLKSSPQNGQTQTKQTIKHGEASNKEMMPDDSYDSPIVIRNEKNKEHTKYQDQMIHSENDQIQTEQRNLIDSTEAPSTEQDIVDNLSIFSDDNDQFDVGSGTINERSSDTSRFSNSNVWSLLTNFHSQERNKFKRCKTTNDEPGNCMPIQLCPTPNLQLTLDDLLKKMCAIDDVFIGICCPEFPAETLKVDWETFQNVSSNDQESTEMKFEECGIMSEESHSWPWMALLISISTRKIFCGGVLINSQYVLTAAHCTRKIPRNQIVVALGPIEKDATNREFEVVEIKRHALYNPKTMQNDIALLKLSRKVSRSSVCLPHEITLAGKEAVMLGWRGSFSESKSEEKLKILPPEECSKEGVLCTEPRTEDVMCNVDSGAPLIMKHKERYEVIGLLTWNRNDCNFPALFTQVSHFKGWIENHSSF